MQATATTYMNGTTKRITLGEHQTVVGKLSYGGQIERDLLVRQFYDTEAGDHPLNRARWNFFCLSTQTLDDPPCELAHSSDSAEEFARKLDGLMALDNDLVVAWVVAISEMNTPLVDKAQLPASLLSEAEKKDPKSSRRARS
jgi:hypothetical protein